MAAQPPSPREDPALAEPTLPKGAVLGRYIIIEPLGRGAMGVVYTAYDPELDRKLALKLLRHLPAIGGGEQARLLREGQAMARLSHPNVVAVYDVGTFGEGVFVALELVEGKTLRAWLREEKRAWRAVVAMLAQAGRGLAAAHAASIVHRDFKPDNVLVGADGRARVLDFGLARAPVGAGGRSEPPTSGTPPAGLGSVDESIGTHGSFVGTPRYLPPEQLAGERVDERADQFAFCASLWEALYGEAPFEGDDLLTLLGNLREGKLRDPRARDVPGWIRPVLTRGLASDPAARFPSMGALLEVLEHDPGERRRRWVAWGAVSAAIALAVVGTRALGVRRAPVCPSAAPELAGVWDDARSARMGAAFRATGMPFAEDAWRGTAKALSDYAIGWVHMHGEACEATRVRGEQSSELLDLRMACLRDRLAGMRALVDQLVGADARAVEGALRAADDLAPLAECADLSALRAPLREPADRGVRARIDDLRRQLADSRATRFTSKPADAVPLARRIAAEARDTGYLPLQAEALENEGVLLETADDVPGAITALQDAQLTAVAGHHSSVETLAWIDLAHALAHDLRDAEGRSAAKQARACLDRDGDDEERLATLLVNEGTLATDEGRYDEALEKGKQALAIRERRLPADHPDIAASLNQLGVVLWQKGDLDESLAFHRRALAIREKAFGPAHPLVAASLGNISNTLSAQGDDAGAVTTLMRVLEIQSAAFGPGDRVVADALSNLSLSLSYTRRNAEALDTIDRAIAIRLRVLGRDHPDVAVAYGNRAVVLLALERWDDAIESATKRLELQERANGADYPPLARPLLQIGKALLGKRDPARAIPYLERALRVGGAGGLPPNVLAQVREALALALRGAQREPARVRELTTKARETYVSEGAKGDLVRVDGEFRRP